MLRGSKKFIKAAALPKVAAVSFVSVKPSTTSLRGMASFIRPSSSSTITSSSVLRSDQVSIADAQLPRYLRKRLSTVAASASSSTSTSDAAGSSDAVPGFGSPRQPRSNKTSIMFTVSDTAGSLQKALSAFSTYGVNMTRLESKPSLRTTDYEFHVDFEGTPADAKVKALMDEIRRHVAQFAVMESKKVAWFPRRKKDLDIIANEILDAGADLEADHPGFHDKEYRARRQQQANVALNYRYGDSVPKITYTPEETACWGEVYKRIRPLHEKYACAEHLRLLPLFEQNCGYSATNIPQIQDISDFLQDCTGFTLRPVAGLLSTRNFLYGLAFRTFFSTQYLRHHSRPLYTPEPDIVHELMGHAPLFADQNFADFSQLIGLASIGATDEQIEALGRVYWFSVEFGLCQQNGQLKAYGAGLLSSYGEMEYSMGLNEKKPELREFDPFAAARQDYPITTYQHIYYVASSFEDAKRQMTEFAATLQKPFHVRYNPYTSSIDVDANLDLTRETKKKPASGTKLTYASFGTNAI